MKLVSSPDADRIEYRGGGGVLIVPGLLFGVVGIGVAGVCLRLVWRGDSGALGGAAMGSIFALLGCIVCLGRNGLDLDLRARSYRRWWSVLLPLRSHSGSLDEFDRVLLAKELRRSKHGTYSVFTVRLAGDDKAQLAVTAERTYEAARQSAEDLAKRIRLNLVDSTWGEDLVTPPGHVDESLRERFQREGRPAVDLSHPPAGMRSRIEISGRTIRLHLPAGGFQRRFLAPIAALLLFEGFAVFAVLLPFFKQRNFQGAQLTDLGLLLVFGVVFFAMPALAVGSRILSQTRTKWTIEVSPEGLTLEQRTPLRSRKYELPGDRIVAVEIDAGRVPSSRRRAGATPERDIVVISKDRQLALGGHLPEEEKEWIRGVIEQVLSS